MTLTAIIFAGIVTYLSRMTMVTFISSDMLNEKFKKILGYVPSAVFPAIIFPGVFLNDFGYLVELNDPKIIGASIALLVGYFSKSVIGTIVSGLFSYWFIIFVIY
tara:strand:- start:207 stop:521 length:315 start_codon:yes stop_codon:yes gene_type:complete